MRKFKVAKDDLLRRKDIDDTYFNNEQCSLCGKEKTLLIDVETDNYVCKRCAKRRRLIANEIV